MVTTVMTTTALAAQPPNNYPIAQSGRREITLYWVNVRSATATLAASGATFTARATVAAIKDSADIDGTLYLEQLSGGEWSEVDSWSISGTGRLSGSGTYAGASKGTYRSRAVVTVGAETIDIVSASKTI